MSMPLATERWIQVVGLHVDRAIAGARSESPPSVVDDAIADELALSRLAARLKLSREEVLTAWCLVAGQLMPRIGARIEGLSGNAEVTNGALAAIAYAERPARAIAELSPEGKLMRYGLVESADDTRAPAPSWSRRTVRATDRLLELALETGTPELDRSLAAFARIEPARTIEELAVEPDVVERVRAAVAGAESTVIVAGRPGLGRRSVLAAIAKERGIETLQIDARRMARELPGLRQQLRAVARECALLERAPLIAGIDAMTAEAIEVVHDELVAGVPVALATCGPMRPTLRWRRVPNFIELEPPSSELRKALWLRALGQGSDSDGELLATTYPMAPALICHAAEAAKARCPGTLTPEAVLGGIRSVVSDRLGHLATKVTSTHSWDDIVLTAEQAVTVTELLARIRERRRVYETWGFARKVGRGLGVSALFSGPPGTGKTMVAAIIAKELGLELYQVDLAKIVSKWVGETEKQLAELFDGAEAGHAVLLFDEADSMFGKRTEVKSSNDRYANLETNYLLQRLESFTGVCLLTSNHDGNIDPAFRRRLALHVRFELPEVSEREALWRTLLASGAPISGPLAFDSLAKRFEMSGGHIKNAALRAAFLAADENGSITMVHLERAAQLEYEALGKIVA